MSGGILSLSQIFRLTLTIGSLVSTSNVIVLPVNIFAKLLKHIQKKNKQKKKWFGHNINIEKTKQVLKNNIPFELYHLSIVTPSAMLILFAYCNQINNNCLAVVYDQKIRRSGGIPSWF